MPKHRRMNYIRLAGNIVLGLAALGLCASCEKQAPDPFAAGMVASYLADGRVNGGRVVGATPAPDRLGHDRAAYSFNGQDNCVQFDSVPMKQVDDWTLTAWINPATLPQNGMAVCLGKDDGRTGDGFSFGLSGAQVDSPGDHLYGVLGGVSWLDSGYVFPAPNTWYQVVMLRREGTVRFYVNGSPVNNAAGGPGSPNGAVSDFPRTTIQANSRSLVNNIRSLVNNMSRTPLEPTAFTLGSATGIRFFNGSINAVRIYSRALTDDEVQGLYQYEKP